MQSFPLLLDPPDKPDHQAIHCATANFGPLLRGSITNLIRLQGLSKISSDSECSVLTHFSMGLTYKYVNLKEPYNQNKKEQVITKNFLKKKTGFT